MLNIRCDGKLPLLFHHVLTLRTQLMDLPDEYYQLSSVSQDSNEDRDVLKLLEQRKR